MAAKLKLVLHEKPDSTEELAFTMGLSGQVASLAKKLGLDPTKISVTLDFETSKQRGRFSLESPD